MADIQTIKPRYLYRYRSLTPTKLHYETSALQENYLWCSNFHSLNDPMEGSYEASFRLKKAAHYPQVKEKILGEKDAVGICSFSETNDNSVMWAHYADQFGGVCIEYSFEKLLEMDGFFTRVIYNEVPYRVSVHALSDDELARKILSHKSHRWLYEREWRFFRDAGEGKHYLPDKCITGVFIGNRISENIKMSLFEMLSAKKIKYKFMEFGGYSIRFK